MKANSLITKINSRFALVLIIYSVLGLFLLRHYQYQINPDEVSYISIAQKYARGDFYDAINGYWGPLFSWLLTPFLFLGLPPLFAFKIISLIIGTLTLIGTRSLSYRFEMEERTRSVILFSMIPIILFLPLVSFTPDLLLACILVFYLTIIFKTDYPGTAGNGVLCGALGSVAYLCKAYAFPFFISHFLLCNVIHYLRSATKESKRGVLRNLLLGFACFSVISAGWICLISNKYNKLTFGTAGAYNLLLSGPESQGHPVERQGFLKPPNKTAISAWEDPSYLIPKMKPWSPMDSRAHFKHQARRTLQNVHRIFDIYNAFSFLSLVIILFYILLCIKPFNKTILQKNSLFPLVTIMLYPIGYALLAVTIRGRYLWIVYILLILMGGYLLNILFRNDFFNDVRKKIVLMLFVLSFVVMPLKELVSYFNLGNNLYSLSKVLERKYNVRGNIASNDNWGRTLFLSFYLNCQYYGVQRKGDISSEYLVGELNKHSIDYYFVWGKCNENLLLLANYKDVVGVTPGLRIYYLKGNK
jgi:hypothetical protein